MKRLVAVLSGIWLLAGCGSGSSDPDGGQPDGHQSDGNQTDGGGCQPGETDCDGACVDTFSDPNHCGTCFAACTSGQVCSQGECQSECPAGLTDCAGACVDLEQSPQHCGACDRACVSPGAEGDCIAWECGNWRCLPGYVDTDGDLSNGCEGACAGREINGPGALDYDLDTVLINGRVTVNGVDPGPSQSGATRGSLSFSRAGGGKPAVFDLDATGPADYQAFLLTGVYTIELQNQSDCPEGPFPCGNTILRRDMSLVQDGVLDLDVENIPVQDFLVSGRVTVNQAAMPTSGTGAARGVISFQSEDGYLATSDLGTSGPADYEVTLVPGRYSVSVSNPDDCPDGALPCQPRTVRADLNLSGPGVLDLDLTVIDVSGLVTIHHQPVGPSATGQTRGSVTFADQEGSVADHLGESGSALYQVKLYPGDYDVLVSNSSDCPESNRPPIPCQTRTQRTGMSLQATGTLDLDLDVVEVSGLLTVNGQAMPDSASGGERGQLILQGSESQLHLPLGLNGPADWEARLFADSYDFMVVNSSDCPTDRPGTLPCRQKTIREGLVLTGDGVADFDLEVITVEGQVTVNQAVMSPGSQNRGNLVFSDTGDYQEVRIPLGSSGAASYQALLYPGSYQVGFDNRTCLDDVVPCQQKLLHEGQLSGGGVLDLDLSVLRVYGRVTVNAETMPPSPSNTTRGYLTFDDPENGPVSSDLGTQGDATYEVYLLPGGYSVMFDNHQDCPEGAVPCQSMVIRDNLALSMDGVLDLDLRVVGIGGLVTVDGTEMPASVSGADRGILSFSSETTGQVLQVELGTTGRASYQIDLFPDVYGISFEGTDCPGQTQGAAPCQGALLEGCTP